MPLQEATPRVRPTHSLRWRLPVLLTAIVIGAIAASLWTAYRLVERSLTRAGGDRARVAADQLGTLLEGSTQQGFEQLRRAALAADVRRFVKEPTADNKAAAERALRPLTIAGPRWVTLWTSAGVSLVSTGVPAAGSSAVLTLPSPTQPATPGINPLQRIGDQLFVDSAVEVLDPSEQDGVARPLGILSVRSTIAVSPPGIIGRLVGEDAVVTIGNRRGDVWTDLSRIVPAPAVDLTQEGVAEDRADAANVRLGALREIRATPFAVWVSFPRAAIVAPARTFLRQMVPLAALLVLAAAALVSLVTFRLTHPLSDITRAAAAVAAGDYSRRLSVHRDDEIGRLGDAFDAMTVQIQDGQRRLEARIAERTKTLEALQESEARHRAIVDVAFDCIVTIDAYGTVTEFNPTAERTFGYTRSEAVGRELAELIVPPRLREAHRQGLARYLTSGENRILGKLLEMTAVRSDGTEFPVELAIMKVAWDGPVMLTGVIRDITARKTAEAQLRQAQKMEAVGQLAGGVAHDFNNMLTVILGYAQSLAEQIGSDKPVGRDLGEIVAAARRAAALTRQLLAFSRRQTMKPTPVSLNGVVDGLTPMLRRLIRENVTIRTTLDATTPIVIADAMQLEQVLLNLVVNARDAMPDGGKITIDTRRVSVDAEYASGHPVTRPGEYAVLSVIDSGVGMRPEVRDRIFEPFFTTKEAGQGTGLGLAAVYGIVKQLDGYIWVYSEPGQGSVFKVYLPLTDRPVDGAAPRHAGGAPVGRETILLVEDEEAVRSFARRVLERHGYVVLEAASAEAALELVADRGGSPDVVLTDVMLPGMNGGALARLLRQRRPAQHIVFMSGYAAPVAGSELPPDAELLEKPFTAETLLAHVRQVLET